MFLGGPLFYNKGLRKAFKETLKLDDENAVFPDYSLYAVALGASIFAEKSDKVYQYDTIIEKLEEAVKARKEVASMPALFENEEEFIEFKDRHAKETVEFAAIEKYEGDAFLGIDCGSTTTKLVLINKDREILWNYYNSNKGNPVDVVKEELTKVRKLCGDRIKIRASAVTGYGEQLIMNAFLVDKGLVETMAHFMASKQFLPNVDFILDIGGQDIKCIKIKNEAVDSIMLNEACSSGCGSFIETFAKSMGYDSKEFSKLGLKGNAPVDLGSRCTVFMNSSIKQAQKDGVSVENISAGISVSVIKNAIYKVIRANSPTELGEHIVVQGGTFLNDAVLRAFEKEIGKNVVRPAIAGIMGAYGAAIYSMSLGLEESKLLTLEELESFTHTSKASVCQGCTNHCALTINIFSDGGKFISGNRCEKMVSKGKIDEKLNLFEFKRQYFMNLAKPVEEGKKVIGMPLQLGMYDLAPLWVGIFEKLGFSVKLSGMSSRETYLCGQDSIPSDTVCYPAKLMHGHIETLIKEDVDAIFAPCLTYNLDEKAGDNHYNCPVVAYYPELLKANMEILAEKKYLAPFLNICDEKELARELEVTLPKDMFDFKKSDYLEAVREGFKKYYEYKENLYAESDRIIARARELNKKIMVLAGRPYHIDPEISHGIDLLACSLGFAVVTEEAVARNIGKVDTNILNQWTFHQRLYRAAHYCVKQKDMELVQLVSFGCGIDAITTDEVRSIVENEGRIYTQIKIDEINNLSAVNIRLRSLLGALEMREGKR